MNFPRPFIALLLTISLLSGCDQIIDVELPAHDPQLNINSTFDTEQFIWIAHLSSSVGILEEGDPEIITNGSVVLYADGVLRDTFRHVQEGFYWSTTILVPVEGVNYEIRANAPGYSPSAVTARDTTLSITSVSE